MSSVNLTWAADGNIDSYNIYRSTSPMNIASLPAPLATGITTKSYSDTTAANGTKYYYRVASVAGSTNKISSEISVSTVTNPVLSLFTNNEKGLWLDFSDMSQMYQDSAGTVSVTAVSQPVGKVLDKSGNSNHAAQTASSRRPVFQTDGAFFDGVDDFLKTIAAVDYGQTNYLEVFLKIKSLYRSTSFYGGVTLESGDPSYTANGAGGFISLAPEENDSITAGSNTSSSIVAVLYPGSGRVYDGVYSIRINNSEVALIGKDQSYSTPKTGETAIRTDFLNIGARAQSGEPVLGFYGYIKHLVIVNRELTALERSNLTAFLESH